MRKLSAMIIEEEKRDSTEEVVDVVLFILDDERSLQDFADALEFLEDEFQDTLAQGEFLFAFKLLSGLRKLRESYKIEKPWALPLLDDFFIAISNPQVLGVLQQVLSTADVGDSEQMKMVRQLLLLLPPEAILALGPLLPQIHSYRIQRHLTEIIGSLANRDLRPLEELLDRPEEPMVRSLVYILGHLKGERPTQILLKMTNHSSDQIRKQTLKILMEREPQLLDKVFSLIDDPSVSVRDLMLEWLEQRRDEKAEGLLLDYLEQRRFQRPDRQHLLPCYKALGRCGSSRSIPFLQGVLLNRGWMPGSLRSIHRQGAAAALSELDTVEAKEILGRASRSPFSSVRSAYRKAVEGNP
jgi:HEAT repeat protein